MRNPLSGPYILAMDAALSACSAGVCDSVTGKILATRTIPMLRGQSEALVPLVQDVLAMAGIGFADLGRIVTTVGPGGFTGLRIGISTARSFGTALGIPVDGVLTTAVIAQQIYSQNSMLNGDLLVLIETKRSDLYFHHFKSQGSPVTAADTMEIPDLLNAYGAQPLFLAGDGVGRCRAMLGAGWPACWEIVPGGDYPDPAAMAALVLMPDGALPAEPVYLRGPDVSLSSRPQRVIGSE